MANNYMYLAVDGRSRHATLELESLIPTRYTSHCIVSQNFSQYGVGRPKNELDLSYHLHCLACIIVLGKSQCFGLSHLSRGISEKLHPLSSEQCI